jgi:hypothetical protein
MVKSLRALVMAAMLTAIFACSVAAEDSVGACGWIPGQIGDRAQFQGYTDVDAESGFFAGFLNYRDPSVAFRLRATEIGTFTREGCTVILTGTGRTSQGPNASWQVRLTDNAQPGRNNDVFEILVVNEAFEVIYTHSGVLGGGEIETGGPGVSCP